MVKTIWVLVLLYTSPGEVHTFEFEQGVYDTQEACVAGTQMAGQVAPALQPFLRCVFQIDA